jgi:exonuclease III
MHIIEWNVNGLRSRLRELDILGMRHSPAAICLQEHTSVLRMLLLSEATHHTSTTIFPEKGRMVEMPSLSEGVYILARSSYKATYKL